MNATLSEPSRTMTCAMAMAIAIAGLFAYATSFRNDFVWDDASSVLMHEHVHDPGKIAQLFTEDQHAFGRGQGNFYRPLVSVSFMLDYQLATGFGANDVAPFVFHLTNLAWHIAAALAFLALVRALGVSPFVAFAAPLLYVVHPLHTEAIAYISGRADPMAATFMFAGLTLALRTRGSVRGIVAGTLSILCFAAALLSKESAMIYPVLLALVLLAQRATRIDASRAGWLVWIATLVMLGIYGWLRATVLNFGSDSTVVETSLFGRMIQALQAYGAYIRLIFWPSHLHMERTLDGYTWVHTVLGLVALLLTLVALGYALFRRRPIISLGLAWFLATWIPISGIFPLNAPMAEHWMYVPLAGFVLALTAFIDRFVRAPKLLAAARAGIACAALLLVALALARNDDWRDNETLFRATLAENPNSSRVHFNLAVTYEDLLGNLTGASRHYEKVLELSQARKTENDANQIFDEELGSHLSLGKIYFKLRRYDLALQHFQVLAGLQPTETNKIMVASAVLGLGQCLLATGDPRALEIMQKAIELEPGLRPELARILRDAA